MNTQAHTFVATLRKIGINPYVSVPDTILAELFQAAGKDRGAIPVKGTVNEKAFVQNLVKYAGAWRLYINLMMLDNSPQRIGEQIRISIAFDPEDRTLAMHASLREALNQHTTARLAFEKLPPSRQKEIIRYISNLKTDESRNKNIERAIQYLQGNGTFVGLGILKK